MTSGLMAVMTSICCSALFSVQVLPFAHSDTQCFMADIDGAGGGDIFVIDGRRLVAYSGNRSGADLGVDLDPAVTALDVGDIDGDGRPDLVAVAGDRILSYSLNPESPREPTLLFELHTQFSAAMPRPFSRVLVLVRDGRPLLALPTDTALELRTPSGVLVESHAIGNEAAARVSFGQPFSALPVYPPRLGSANMLELHVTRTEAFIPRLPEDLSPANTPAKFAGGAAQARNVGDMDPESWPWFQLQVKGEDDERVFFAYDPRGARESLVRIRRAVASPQGKGHELKMSGEQRYPGFIVPCEATEPDFDGDGHADILLWNTTPPAPTVGSVTRAIMEGRWPVRLSIHLYDPKAGRYSTTPFAVIPLDVPVTWIVGSSGELPVEHLVLADFNGDGRTDIGCATAPTAYSVWVSLPSGIRPEPHQTIDLPGEPKAMELRGDMDGEGRTSIVLQGDRAFYVLRARKGG